MSDVQFDWVEEGGSSQWHDTGSLSDGTPTGRMGACWHILDRPEGSAISEGFHEIRSVRGGYEAEIGAAIYRLDESGGVVERIDRSDEEMQSTESAVMKAQASTHSNDRPTGIDWKIAAILLLVTIVLIMVIV